MVNENELRNDLSKKPLKNVYFIFGDDQYLVKRYSAVILKKAVGDDADLNLTELSDGMAVSDINDRLMQFSFTGDRICVSVANFDFEGCPIAEFKSLISVIEAAPQNNTLVLYYDSLHFNTKKSDRYKKLAAAVEKSGGAVAQLNHKTNSQLSKMLCDGAKKRGCILKPEVANYMISVCTNDLNILINELDKLTAYLCGHGEITTDTVDFVCTRTVDVSIFDMSKYILSGNGNRAICLLRDLQAMGLSPVEILANITSVYVDIFRAAVAVKAGVPLDDAAKTFGYAPNRYFVFRNAAASAKKLTDKQLSEMMNELLKADRYIKNQSKLNVGGSANRMEYLITRLIMISRGK